MPNGQLEMNRRVIAGKNYHYENKTWLKGYMQKPCLIKRRIGLGALEFAVYVLVFRAPRSADMN